MPAPLEDDAEDAASLPTTGRRCARLELESGDVVLYDTDNHSAWIQSDGAVDLEALA